MIIATIENYDGVKSADDYQMLCALSDLYNNFRIIAYGKLKTHCVSSTIRTLIMEKRNRRTVRPSISIARPDLLSEWDYEKNTNESPKTLTLGSDKKVWWKCNKGHEWKASVSNKVMGRGCPFCSNKKLLKGYNDLYTINPQLASEWHPTKNGDLTPKMITGHSSKKVWWKCVKGHEWEASVDNRVKGRKCPYCSNKQVLKGFNDLSTTHPEIAEEWHPTKNANLTPEMVVAGSAKKVWWKCTTCGHEWKTAIRVRVKGHGCPECGIKKSLKTRADNLHTK